MVAPLKTGRQAREEREKSLMLKHKFENRITITKYGKKSLNAGNYPDAIKNFTEYMQIMADIKKTKDIFLLKPSHFDPSKDLTEMLMISHVYFEMARIYDAVPKFAEESKKCLDQFVAFSINQPYQVVNSEMIRKYLKKSVFKNQERFRAAYLQIYVQSKKCYVVTFCYGENHELTRDYRRLKDKLLETEAGCELVRTYYGLSSKIVPRWEGNTLMLIFAHLLIKPMLLFLSKTVLRFIIK
jgi:hypothetical protein